MRWLSLTQFRNPRTKRSRSRVPAFLNVRPFRGQNGPSNYRTAPLQPTLELRPAALTRIDRAFAIPHRWNCLKSPTAAVVRWRAVRGRCYRNTRSWDPVRRPLSAFRDAGRLIRPIPARSLPAVEVMLSGRRRLCCRMESARVQVSAEDPSRLLQMRFLRAPNNSISNEKRMNLRRRSSA